MGVRNAGAAIREARLKAGLTQEQLSKGVCSVLSLSRIENGTAGVSPSTFQALMAHAGAPCEAFPIFANRSDFDCFYSLKRVGFYLDSWQLKEAYTELEKIQEKNWAENKYYYQEWLLMHCKLQFRSGMGNHQEISNHLEYAIHISRPDINFYDFRNLLLSLNEIELLILYAQESLYLNKTELCLAICTQISSYLENSQITFLEKDLLLAEYAVVYAKYLIASRNYEHAILLIEQYRNTLIKNADDDFLHELTFIAGVSYYYQNQTDKAIIYFKTAIYSAHSIGSCYATICQNYLTTTLQLDITIPLLSISDIPLSPYEKVNFIDYSNFKDGVYDLFSPDTLTIGSLIRMLRIEQNISQKVLCQGLCSKSKLSKIETGLLQPNVALTQSILQRLGIADNVFTFYANEHETTLQDLKLRLILTKLHETNKMQMYADEMLKNCSDKEFFYIQYASCRKAHCISNPDERASYLLEVLKYTLPNFNFNNMINYRLSWLEITILNTYNSTYGLTNPSKAILNMYKLLDYYDYSNIDVLEKRRVFPVSLHLIIRFLYREKRFTELIDLKEYFNSSELKYSLDFIRLIYGHYSQALAETGQTDLATLHAYYAYYNFVIINLSADAEKFRQDFEQDYNISLL